MEDTIETERLLLQPLKLEDAEQTQKLFPEWEIVQFLAATVPWPYPRDGAYQFYKEMTIPAIERGEEWHWTIRLKESPVGHIGAIGLSQNEWDNRGYWLGLPWHGRGFMTEAVVAINNYWFNDLGNNVLRAPKAIVNKASRRISEKTGMRVIKVEERDFVSGRLMAEIWEITAEEWNRARTLTAGDRT